MTQAKETLTDPGTQRGNEIGSMLQKHKVVGKRSEVEKTKDALSNSINLPIVVAMGGDLVQLNSVGTLLPSFMLIEPGRNPTFGADIYVGDECRVGRLDAADHFSVVIGTEMGGP